MNLQKIQLQIKGNPGTGKQLFKKRLIKFLSSDKFKGVLYIKDISENELEIQHNIDSYKKFQ